MALIDKLTAIGDAIRGKEGTTEPIPLNDMATRITNLPSGGGDNEPTDAELVLGGNQQYRFAGGAFDWVINQYGNRITTRNLSECSYMFQYSTVENIPFQFNFDQNGGKIGYMFVGCSNLKQIAGEMDVKQTSSAQSSSSVFKNCGKLIAAPKLLNMFPNSMDGFFCCCYNLRNLPDDYFASWNFSKTIDYN